MAAQSPPPYDLKDGTNVSWYTNYARQSRQHNYHESADNVTSAMPMDITVESRPLSGLNSPYQGGWQSTTYEHGPWQVSGDFSHQYIHPPGHYTTVPLTDRDPLGEHSDKRDYTSTQRHGLSIAHARSGKNSKRGSVGTMLKLWSSDIAAILLAICVLVGVFVLLAYYDGKQTSTWTHPIALTTVVSILSTANSTALASVASNIISQAKWTWFWSPKTNPRLQGPPIKDMERFDQASRGVSGASFSF
ncbi:hypothetical protein RRF57_011949 [Xylaria bambusicola]|uniref:Uncharacterized protein n=1 Tax=Xylaria bambusicola TaxID=326684 RepID=A0AAN7UUG5_9PEZI